MAIGIEWLKAEDGVRYRLTGTAESISSQEWPLMAEKMMAKDRKTIPILMSLLEDELADEISDGLIHIPYTAIAQLNRQQTNSLMLPEWAPLTLSLEGRGLLTDKDFELAYDYMTSDSRPLLGSIREGVFLRAGSREWIIPDPIYSLVESIDKFNAEPTENNDERFLKWSRVKQLLPDDAIVDDYLKGMQVALGTSFTLEFRSDELGRFTFDPILVREDLLAGLKPVEDYADPTEDESPKEPSRSLPPASERELARTFRKFRDAKKQYALGNGMYIVVDEPVRKALEVVRQKQEAPENERRAFAANPHAALREQLGDELSEECLAGLFFEPSDYGERVAAAGIWVPKVLPFLKKATEPWMPPEEFGLLINGVEVLLTAEEIPELKKRIQDAMAISQPTVEHKEIMIPATTETLESIETIEKPLQGSTLEKTRLEDKPTKEKVVLLLQDKDNLNEFCFSYADWNPRNGAASIPKGIRSTLKPHQETGVRWMQKHWLEGSPGALLADDIGLGKTLQCLAFLLWMREQTQEQMKPKPFLIVAPTGLLQNWADEHDFHLLGGGLGLPLRAYGERLRALRHPDASGRTDAETGAPVLRVREFENASWVLTTYETLRDYSHSFGRIRWAAMILDEVQKIKNPNALVTEECKAVASNADFVLTMTGTPVENRLADIWSIVDTCQPGVLRDLKSFVAKYDSSPAIDTDLLKDLQRQITDDFNEMETSPKIMLRRMKADELDGLPEKTERYYEQEMPQIQAETYKKVVKAAKLAGKQKGAMLQALHQFRIISLHPKPAIGELSDEEYIASSARFIKTFEILDAIHARKERVLVFLEFKVIQPILQGLIQRRYKMDHRPMIINGQVSGDRRKGMVTKFQEGRGFDVMILSPRAGGVGLTLTSANHVIHLSRWWNPAVEDQCTDRIYRIGQEKKVSTHIPIARHPEYDDFSFDVKLNALLERKREISRHVLGLVPAASSSGDLEELYSETVDNE
ncbi:MAG: DEAD/DEAH box helicase [Candidatus Eisenbacteria bacterium]|nr:DEAD/DEAH box helicase [Candidatus Eisenbacteria bacterium]